ncbi:MAG: hypothetical protein U9N45_02850, partial [Gemmatimonadota bacterium]|nr:hypothetical protein [Gemmatimonadota bacterium]
KDVKDFFAAVAYKLSRREETPRFSRFDYIEKFEYFSVVWGCVIMIITGAALWFPEKATLLFPLWVLEILRVIHGYEAVLAGLAIIIWHMYHANLKPSVFPMSKVWLNGLITLEELHENHPLEFESLLAVLPSKTVGRIKKQMG